LQPFYPSRALTPPSPFDRLTLFSFWVPFFLFRLRLYPSFTLTGLGALLLKDELSPLRPLPSYQHNPFSPPFPLSPLTPFSKERIPIFFYLPSRSRGAHFGGIMMPLFFLRGRRRCIGGMLALGCSIQALGPSCFPSLLLPEVFVCHQVLFRPGCDPSSRFFPIRISCLKWPLPKRGLLFSFVVWPPPSGVFRHRQSFSCIIGLLLPLTSFLHAVRDPLPFQARAVVFDARPPSFPVPGW